jgi:hypothetical protein
MIGPVKRGRPALGGRLSGSLALKVAALHPLAADVGQPFGAEGRKRPPGASGTAEQHRGTGHRRPAERWMSAQPAKRLWQNGELGS